MGKIFFETLLPEEIIHETEGVSTVYLPVGSMEWHGPHMGMGLDTFNAYEVSIRTAKAAGGVVFPPLFIGTESPRTEEQLKKVGFSGTEKITGMDFPENTVKSFYWPPELFEAVIREQTEMFVRHGFKKIVIINGHGADEQIRILDKIVNDLKEKDGVKAVAIMALMEGCGAGLGHAGLAETAIMCRVHPEGVDLSRLPSKPEKLQNIKFAIVDSETFEKGPNGDFSVRYDPRDATEELGEHILDFTARKCAEIVKCM